MNNRIKGSEPANLKYKTITDPTFGFKRLDPIPDSDELSDFYQNQYYDLIKEGQRAPELFKLTAGGKAAADERIWLRETLYADILAILDDFGNLQHKRLLDVGCGTGDFISFMNDHGWESVGLELSLAAAEIARNNGLEVYSLSIEEYVAKKSELPALSVVTMLNVLEHVPDPIAFISSVSELLSEGDVIVIRVPNDFTELQLCAQQKLKKEPWWVAAPDHINYFDFQTLSNLLEKLGFEVLYSQGDFPMEIFLLMGEDYTANPEVGKKCHQKRVSFEMSIGGQTRRRIYQALAMTGVGRDCLVFGRLKIK